MNDSYSSPYNLSFNKENLSNFKTKIRTESPSRNTNSNQNIYQKN